MGKSRFQNHWLQRPEFVGWLRRDSKDVFRAYCNVCQRSFHVKNMGECAVKSHAGGAKHIANMKQSSSAGSASSFSPPARRVENERSTVSDLQWIQDKCTMEKQYSVQFFSSFVEAMQKLCREYLDFDQGVELSGYLAVEIDNFKKERYVLSELIQSTGHVISESYCTKAFKTHRKEVTSYGSENQAPQASRYGSRTSSQGPDYTSVGNNQDRFSSRMYSNIRPRQRQNFTHRRPVRNPVTSVSSRIPETISLVDDSSPVSQFEESAGSQEQTDSQNCIPHDSSFSSQQVGMNSSPQTSHVLTSSPVSTTPQKRNSSATEDFPPSKKDKLDSSLESLYDVAKDITSNAQSDIDSMNSSYPMFSKTSGAETIPTSVSNEQTSQSDGDSVRMPVVVKEEKPDDVPYMVLDDPNVLDPEVHVKTLDKSLFSAEHDNSQTFGLDGTTSFSSDMPGSSSFTSLQDSKYSGNAADGGGSWDNQVATKEKAYNDLTEDLRYSKKDHICETCNKKFTYNWTLVRHQQSVHQRLFIHTCPVCGKNFNRKDVLALHVNSHLKSASNHSSLYGSNLARHDLDMSNLPVHDQQLDILNDLPLKEEHNH